TIKSLGNLEHVILVKTQIVRNRIASHSKTNNKIIGYGLSNCFNHLFGKTHASGQVTSIAVCPLVDGWAPELFNQMPRERSDLNPIPAASFQPCCSISKGIDNRRYFFNTQNMWCFTMDPF